MPTFTVKIKSYPEGLLASVTIENDGNYGVGGFGFNLDALMIAIGNLVSAKQKQEYI